MASGAEINTSLGLVDVPEKRSFGRKYITWGKPVNNAKELITNMTKFLPHTIGARRFVMRGLLSDQAIKTAKKLRLPIEAGIPMKYITGNDDGSAIIYIAKNRHKSPPQGDDPVKHAERRGNGRSPLERARTMKNESRFSTVNSLTLDYMEDLFTLWQRFGWTRQEVINFILRIQNKEKNLWFSGMRDNLTGRLVSASNAEAIEFAGIRYIETTEYSTLKEYENQSLSTTAVSGLIAQILRDAQYSSDNELINVITAEFNTSSNSTSVGVSAGFEFPKIPEVKGILSYNVAVEDNTRDNEVFKNSEKSDRGIPYSKLRDFALAVLPINHIQELYPLEVVREIISYYQ